MQEEETIHDDDDECRIFSGQGNLYTQYMVKTDNISFGASVLSLHTIISLQAMYLIHGV